MSLEADQIECIRIALRNWYSRSPESQHIPDELCDLALKGLSAEANYEPPTGWELRCEKCGRQQGMACGWPSNCPTGQGSREYVNSSDSSGDPQR